MFFWKRKRAARQAERLAVAEELVGLHLAMNMIASKATGKRERLNDAWARGYMFGAFHGAFQALNIDHTSTEAVGLTARVTAEILEISIPDAGKFLIDSVAMQDDPEFKAGLICGDTEMLAALAKHEHGVRGLARYLRTGKATAH